MFHQLLPRTVALAAAALLVAAACGNDESESEGETQDDDAPTEEAEAPAAEGDGELQLGYVLPETGNLAFLGPPQIAATNYAISEINDAGGVLGEPLPDVVGDDETDNAGQASQAASNVLNQDVDVLIGAAASGMSLAIIDMVTGSEVVQCSGSNTAPTFTDYEDDGYYFRTAPSDELQGPVLADAVIDDGHVDVAILARADDYGRGLANAAETTLEESGASVVMNDTYDPEAGNFQAPAQAVLSEDPDAIILIAFEEGTQIIGNFLEAGWDPSALYGTDGLRSEGLGEDVAPGNPEAIAGMKGTAPASEDNPDFIENLQEFDPELEVLQFAPQVFDCVVTTALAAEVAGTDDPSVLKDHVIEVTRDGAECTTFAECRDLIADGEEIDYNGVSGPLDFTENGEPSSAMIEIYEFDESGELGSMDTVPSEFLDQ